MSCDLQGVSVLVTRPKGQEQSLCDLINQHGGKPIHFPTIAIGPAEDQTTARKILQDIDNYHMVIFISPNAVKYGLGLMGKERLSSGVIICAVGKSTARVLKENGADVDVSPEGPFDSETLLAMPELAEVAGKHILILRGNGGRRLLGDTLMQRGAEVNYAEVYSRKIATADPAPLIANWEREVDIVTATSCGILENLCSLLGEKGRNLLRTTPLAVVSERIMARAQEFGCEKVILANEASDQGLLLAICDWANDTSR